MENKLGDQLEELSHDLNQNFPIYNTLQSQLSPYQITVNEFSYEKYVQ